MVNLGAEWQNRWYDPGNRTRCHVVDHRVRLRHQQDRRPDLGPPSGIALEGQAGDARRHCEAFVALIRLNYSVNTTSDTELDQALALLEEQKPLLRKYTSDEIADLKSGNVWLSHAWSGDVAQVTAEKESVVYVLPSEGGIRGSDAMVLLANAPHPIAAQLFINHMLDAQVSAANTNYIYYMGPNEAAKQYIDPAILEDPTLNPDKATLEKLQELLDLGADLQKYQERWTKLRST
jgi:spermidine/putrescine transport system substrate-binding protein